MLEWSGLVAIMVVSNEYTKVRLEVTTRRIRAHSSGEHNGWRLDVGCGEE